MPMEKNEFRFPDEAEQDSEELENTTADPVAAAGDDDGAGVEVEVVDDTPEVDRGRTSMEDPPKEVTDDELQQYDEGVRKRIRKFSKGYHDERRRAEAAEREREAAIQAAAALAERNRALEENLTKSQSALLAQAKQVVQNELNAARQQFKVAHESGDADAVLKAQEALNTAQSRFDKVSNFKPPVAKAPASGVQPAPQTVTSPAPPAPAAAPRDDRALAWQEKNTWFGANQPMTAFALGLHSDLVNQGMDTSSDEYYRAIDSEVRKRFPEQFKSAAGDSSTSQPARRSPVVAPATRSSPSKTKVTLTKSEVAIARRLGVTPQQYAMQVLALNRKS